MMMEELVHRWQQMRNDVERQIEMLRSGQIGPNEETAATIDDLNALREKLEALLLKHGGGVSEQRA